MITIIQAIREPVSLATVLREYRDYGLLLKHLALRDIRLRYRHASLGLAWVILQPLVSMIVFATVFARVLRPSTGAIPYSLFALAGLVPWNFFSSSASRACLAFVSNGALLTKVYFPRAILPASAVLGSAVDLVAGCVLVLAYSLWNGVHADWRWMLLPAVALQTILATFFISLGLATLNAVQRDVKHAMQFLMQLWLYASPVVYPASLVSGKYRWLFGLNPMTGVLDGFRWCLFGTPPEPVLYFSSLASLVAFAIGSCWLFNRFELSLAERV